MAESNYSFLFFDELAHPIWSSSIVNALGYVLHVSKILLYIHEPSWLDDYGEPMDGDRIATVREGWVEINGFYIEAKRWSPESIFVYITFVAKEKWRKLGGLSCYGGRPEDMLSKYVEWFSQEIKTWEDSGMREETAKEHKEWLEKIGQRQG